MAGEGAKVKRLHWLSAGLGEQRVLVSACPGRTGASPAAGALQEAGVVAAPRGWERFLSGGNGQVLSLRIAWEGGWWICCCLPPSRSRRGYLGDPWGGKELRCAQAAAQIGDLSGCGDIWQFWVLRGILPPHSWALTP